MSRQAITIGWLRGLSDARHGGVELFQVLLGDNKQFATVTRQRDMAGRPFKQSESELRLQLANQNTQARWGNEQSLRGAGEAAMPRDEQEGAELTRGEIDH